MELRSAAASDAGSGCDMAARGGRKVSDDEEEGEETTLDVGTVG